ncbi:NADH:ubiquinone reductase (Na(+)-transporting) subunit B [Trichloromonas sp.]|uniref:NADH:ubiquinone reductase (Na(+)-transporting) subunit B n=1 Tax=Trichloromonas sp. TaxID=3069249 RepID=UPI002A472DF2|nr:NADH:ubiquinone reductase (Na(+)-transporting) subunit B [Trichloromonas sp.]
MKTTDPKETTSALRILLGWDEEKETTDAPLVRDHVNLSRIIGSVLLALLPCFMTALWNLGRQMHLAMAGEGLEALFDWREAIFQGLGLSHDPSSLTANLLLGALYLLPTLLLCALTALFWEALFSRARRQALNAAWLVSVTLLALILPPALPWWQIILGVSFGTVLGKEVFGGTGRNFINPALTAYAFLFFAYPAGFAADSAYIPIDGVTSATPLALAASGGLTELGAALSWSQAFWGAIPGAPGETSTAACLLGAVILLAAGVASWRIMLAGLLGAFALASLLHALGGNGNPMLTLPCHWHLVLGSLAFGLIFMATDPVSAALTRVGQWWYGLLIGAMIILVRVFNPLFPEGTMLAILFGNVFAPVIDRFVLLFHIRQRKSRHGQ